MLQKITVFITLALLCLSFNSYQKELEFNYPKKENATIFMATNQFAKFKKEWKGEDYYYSCEGKNGIVCSVLFYKLSDKEKEQLVTMPQVILQGPISSPLYPHTYFSSYSNLKKYESNEANWGNMNDDFMFRHADVKEVAGTKINQKHMYGFAMFGDDLFVNVHLSKTDCTVADSTSMREILTTLRKKK